MQNVVCERCALLTKAPCAFSHVGQPCGWPDLVTICPDCKKDGDVCSFFAENEAEGACTGLSRLVTLAIRCNYDGAVRRLEPQLRKRIAILSGGETSQAAVSFAAGHAKTYKDGLKIVDGIWLPQDLSTKDTTFYWNRTVQPWQFALQHSTGAEAVTMSGLLGVLGIGPVVHMPTNSAGANTAEPASLAAQIAQLREMVEALTRAGNLGRDVRDASQAAAAALQGARQAGSDNPSHIFNLGGNNSNVAGVGNFNNLPGHGNPSQSPPGADAELVRALAAAGVTPAQIAQIIQSRVAPAQPMEHRNAWFQVAEGTSPLSVYTGMHGETRQAATPKTLHVQTFEASSSNKLSLKLTVWPAAKPESVAVHQFRNLGDDWKRSLADLNVRLVQITPPADRGLVPSIPLNVDSFLEHCYLSLRTYDPTVILRAWEAAHLFMVDEHITKRSKPNWDTVWMMPVFQVELSSGARATGASISDASQYCANWNFQHGQKCKLEPSADCRKIHKCVRCGGPHPVTKCGSRD